MPRHPRPDFRFALITGASSGIGAAFAEQLPQKTDLLLNAEHAEGLSAEAERLMTPGRRIETVAADLAIEEGRKTLIARAEELEIDLLINNAGAAKFGRVLDNSADVERRVVELNAVAPLVLTHALLPGMVRRAREEGRRAGVIFVSSTTAFAPVPYLASYAASKAFDLSFAEALAQELRGEPVDVLALCPGATRTSFESDGFRPADFPGAASPERVAREGLAMLGRRVVHVTGPSAPALHPIALTRYVLSGGIGLATGRFARRRS